MIYLLDKSIILNKIPLYTNYTCNQRNDQRLSTVVYSIIEACPNIAKIVNGGHTYDSLRQMTAYFLLYLDVDNNAQLAYAVHQLLNSLPLD